MAEVAEVEQSVAWRKSMAEVVEVEQSVVWRKLMAAAPRIVRDLPSETDMARLSALRRQATEARDGCVRPRSVYRCRMQAARWHRDTNCT